MASQLGTVEYHLRCIDCDYDLFEQHRDGRCPECGKAIPLTVYGLIEETKRRHGMRLSDTGAINVALHTRHTIDAVNFAITAIHYSVVATRTHVDREKRSINQIDATIYCYAIRDLAVAEFGQRAAARLDGWQLSTFDDVRQMLRDLIEYGAFKASVDEAIAELDSGPRIDPRPA